MQGLFGSGELRGFLVLPAVAQDRLQLEPPLPGYQAERNAGGNPARWSQGPLMMAIEETPAVRDRRSDRVRRDFSNGRTTPFSLSPTTDHGVETPDIGALPPPLRLAWSGAA